MERRLRGFGADVRRYELDEATADAVAGADRAVAAGGDGTIGPVAAAAARAAIPLAVVPVGTANDLARRLRIPLALDDACRLAVDGERTVPLDVARAGDRPFVNVASAGLAVHAAREAGRLKATLGAAAYAVGAARAALRGRPVRCQAAPANSSSPSHAARQVIVANSGAFGAGATVEVADPADRRLDAAVLPARGRIHLVRYAWALRAGSIAAQADVSHGSGAAVTVDVPPGTRFNVDGEVVALGATAFTLDPARAEIVVPRSFA